SELVFAFDSLYSAVYLDLNTKVLEEKKEKENHKVQLNEELIPKQSSLTKSVGGLEVTITQKQSSIDILKRKISKIKSYEGIDFLRQSFSNLDAERKTIETRLTQIENQNLNSRDLEIKISNLTQEISKLEGQIETYSNLLIHQISKNEKNKELLNAILSDSITSLPK